MGEGREQGGDDTPDTGADDDTSAAPADGLDAPSDTAPDLPSDADIVAAARRRHGAVGGIVAASMLGLDQALGRKPREEAPIVIAAGTEPVDIDSDGIEVPLGADAAAVAPPLPRVRPALPPTRRRRRR